MFTTFDKLRIGERFIPAPSETFDSKEAEPILMKIEMVSAFAGNDNYLNPTYLHYNTVGTRGNLSETRADAEVIRVE